jgi:hypothetical protein
MELEPEPEPCDVLEHEEYDCPLCQLNSSDPILSKMNAMEESMTGKVSGQEIYRTLFEFYKHQKLELERQQMTCPEISQHQISVHYQKHKINLKNIVANEIFLANEMQVHFRACQIATRDSSGRKTLNSKSVDQWIRLSKHKLDLVKHYHSLAKQKVNEPGGIKPYEFN